MLVDAATFDSMRSHSDRTAPSRGIWKEPSGFFKRGRSGAWHDVLVTEEERRRYDERVSSLISPDLSRWLHRS
jgi:hypothetical protein